MFAFSNWYIMLMVFGIHWHVYGETYNMNVIVLFVITYT
jgi:hypothetical protein